MKNSTTIGDNIIKILGKESNDEVVFSTLHDWGLSKERVQHMLKRDAVVCGGRENENYETNILVYGRKKIDRIEYWTTDKTQKKEMELPFGVSRFDNEEKITKLPVLIDNKYYFVTRTRDDDNIIKKGEIYALTKSEYNQRLYEQKLWDDISMHNPIPPARKIDRLNDINADVFKEFIINNPDMKEGSSRGFSDNLFKFSLEYGYDENQIIAVKGKGINCKVEYKNNQVTFVEGFDDTSKIETILEGFIALDTKAKEEMNNELVYIAYKEAKVKLSRKKGENTRKINKLSNKKLKNFATYILNNDDYDLIDDIRLVVDWRQEDDSIVNYCEEILKTGDLKAALVNVEITDVNPYGYEIPIFN